MRLIDADAEIEKIEAEIQRMKLKRKKWEDNREDRSLYDVDAELKTIDRNITDLKVEILTLKQYETAYDVISIAVLEEAREKQIPKTLDYEGDGCDVAGNIIYDTAMCPTCGKCFEVDYDDDAKYCPNCGQCLEWEK